MTKRSQARQDKYNLNPDYDTEIYFSGFLVCGLCEEETAIIGSGWVECEGCEDDPALDTNSEYFTAMLPKYFCPVVPLFEVPDKTPKEVKKSLDEAFSLAWSDFSGTANKLRRTIELLILSIAPNLSKGTTHSKIECLKKIDKYKNISIMLMAVKWLGNEGSHAGEDLKENDIAFAFKVIEDILNSLYEGKVNIFEISAAVNDNKGSLTI